MGERGPQVNRKGAVLYSEGLLRKSRLFIKEMEVGLSSGQGGDRGMSVLQWSHHGGGREVRLVEATSLSSPKRPCKEAACMKRPQGAQEDGEATGLSQGQGEQRSPEMGLSGGQTGAALLQGWVGGQVSSPPQNV